MSEQTTEAQWLYLEHEETGGRSQIPNDEAVLGWHEARGWRVVDPPEPAPFIPTPTDADDPDAAAWVTLVHPELPDARHDFPNDPDALAGAAEAGWVEPNRDGSVPKPATARRRAAAATAAIESPPAAPAGEDSSEQAERSATDQEE